METYKINIRSHFKHLWIQILFLIILPFVIHCIMLLRLGSYTEREGFTVSAITFLIFTIPHLILHFRYYLKNRKDVFQIDSLGKNFSYLSYGKEIRFSESDIETMTCYKSRPFAEERMHILPWDIYHYSIITLKNGQKITITSLLIYEFDKMIKFDNLKTKKTLYAWVE